MVNILQELQELDREGIDNLATRLTSTLDRNDLVHILLDMIDPKVMLENIVTSKEEQDAMAKEVESFSMTTKSICIECTDIYNKLHLEILSHKAHSNYNTL